MLRQLWNSASGMVAQSLKIETIANNIANINTPAFKAAEVQFQDILYRSLEGSNNPVIPGKNLLVGQGVKPGAIRISFLLGPLQATGSELDMAIEGDGFFRVILPDGSEAYTRFGSFAQDASGTIVTADGYLVDLIPEDLQGVAFASFTIDRDGTLGLINDAGEVIVNGRVPLYRFQNPEGLHAMGKQLWQTTENSGVPQRGYPAEAGFGAIAHKYLEQSNVNLIEEMSRLILAQRAYEISSQAVKTADEMWGQANQLRR